MICLLKNAPNSKQKHAVQLLSEKKRGEEPGSDYSAQNSRENSDNLVDPLTIATPGTVGQPAKNLNKGTEI